MKKLVTVLCLGLLMIPFASTNGDLIKIAPGNKCCILGGDANLDGVVNVGDPVFLINYIFQGGPPPGCLNEADANVDCQLNVGDVVYLIAYIFLGGPPPQCGCM